MMLKYLQQRWPEIFGLDVEKILAQEKYRQGFDAFVKKIERCLMHGIDTVKSQKVRFKPWVNPKRNMHDLDQMSYAKGGKVKGGSPMPLTPPEVVIPRRLVLRDPIISSTVVSAAGVKPYLLVVLNDGRHYRQSLDGAALFNLNAKIGEALSAYLNPSKGAMR